jgi:hypothetical protein
MSGHGGGRGRDLHAKPRKDFLGLHGILGVRQAQVTGQDVRALLDTFAAGDDYQVAERQPNHVT